MKIKAKIKGNPEPKYFECPSCEYDLGEDEVDRQIRYCPECGQSLDWSEFDGRRFK